MSFTIREATPKDADAMNALLPLLANFDIPAGRNPDDLWMGDRVMLESWLKGEAPDTFTLVAADESDAVVGLALVTMREEMLSHEPSSHLEVLAVSDKVHRQGLGRRLIEACEKEAKALGAGSMTLHVFANNTNARALYNKTGFGEEIIRCYKPI
ncbi:MAG: N-acetyltransferase [Granulosicoccaceae bacterium]